MNRHLLNTITNFKYDTDLLRSINDNYNFNQYECYLSNFKWIGGDHRRNFARVLCRRFSPGHLKCLFK